MIRTRLPMFLMVLFSFLIALPSFRFLILGLDMSFPDMPNHIAFRRTAFFLHITFSPLALMAGSLQMMPRLRSRFPVRHRWGGRFYALSVLIGGLSGIVVALAAEGGPMAQSGFATLSVLWLFSTFQGVRYARARDFGKHRTWMFRSFALTFAGVTLRLYLVGFMVSGFTYTEASIYLAWLCWVPNLFAVEWWVRHNTPAITIKRQGK